MLVHVVQRTEDNGSAKLMHLICCLITPMLQFSQTSFDIFSIAKWTALPSQKKTNQKKWDV